MFVFLQIQKLPLLNVVVIASLLQQNDCSLATFSDVFTFIRIMRGYLRVKDISGRPTNQHYINGISFTRSRIAYILV